MRNRIKDLRTAKGLSQEDLAQELGVSRQTVNAIENDKYDPMLPLAFKISRVFGNKSSLEAGGLVGQFSSTLDSPSHRLKTFA